MQGNATYVCPGLCMCAPLPARHLPGHPGGRQLRAQDEKPSGVWTAIAALIESDHFTRKQHVPSAQGAQVP